MFFMVLNLRNEEIQTSTLYPTFTEPQRNTYPPKPKSTRTNIYTNLSESF